ncbi:MAG: 50S ribosomal protein L22 [Candidatus Kaiserbacteria bacterium]|nr:50S ribosomal protein L22 [Candidatus Kaiserbacteria bacterium]
MKATLKNFRQPARKVLLTAKALRGKPVAHALAMLQMLDKKVSGPMRKLILSAVHNAEQGGAKNTDALLIRDIRVDQGVMLKRWRPRAFGRATPIRRRSSTIHIELHNSV